MLANVVYKILYFLMRKEKIIMALFLAHRIINGKLHFWQIPKTNVWREDIRQILIEEGAEKLVIEEKPAE